MYADESADFRTLLPRNYFAVPKQQGISLGYLKPAEGIESFATGSGLDRGSINWNGFCYRVSGTKLVQVGATGAVTVLGDVGGSGQVSLDYSFDRLAIASSGILYYWNGTTLTTVTDPDIGYVKDVNFIGGYFMTTDGTYLIVTDLTNPAAVNPLKYGSSESDPDPVMAIDDLSNEAYALNRYSIEAFQNIGGDNFPFERVDGSLVKRGPVGTHAYCEFMDTFLFVGSGRNEPVSVYAMTPGSSARVADREVDIILQGYSEDELAGIVVDKRIDKGHAMAYIHLPDRTLVYDANATKALGYPAWSTLDSGNLSLETYRGRNLTWAYGRWLVGDPNSTAIGALAEDTMHHLGNVVGWEFGMGMLYPDGNDAIVTELELVGLPGRAAFGDDPVVWTSHSFDGEAWSQERAVACGKQGQRTKRIAWRHLGRVRHYRMQKFRGTSDARVSFAAAEVQFEPLVTRPGNG